MRFLLAIPLLLLALTCAGCSTAQKKAEKAAQKAQAKAKLDNSRLVEEQRMRELQKPGGVASARGAEILVMDPDKTFDPSRSAVGGRTYTASTTSTKDFYDARKANVREYQARDFYGKKTAWGGDMKFGSKQAGSKTYGTKDAGVKTAQVNTAWDAGKKASVQGLPDGKREYLGPESRKVRTAVDPVSLANWRNGGESVVHSGNSVEKYSTMKTLTVEDIRELLNKSK